MSLKSFNHLMKTLPADEREKLMKTAMAYGLSSNDPAWLILAMNHSGLVSINKAIETLHTQRKIETNTFKEASKEIADNAIQNASNEAMQNISSSIANSIKQKYHFREQRITYGWITAIATLGISFFIAVNFISYNFLKYSFYEQAKYEIYRKVSNEQVRSEWSNTPEGKLSYSLSNVTDIQQFVTCNNEQDGWEIVVKENKRLCLPHPNDNEITGWYIP